MDIPDVTYEKLLEAVGSVEGEYGVFLQSRIFGYLQKCLNLKPEGYFYDITNAYFYGIKCPMAKKKKKPKSKNHPQIQIGLAAAIPG